MTVQPDGGRQGWGFRPMLGLFWRFVVRLAKKSLAAVLVILVVSLVLGVVMTTVFQRYWIQGGLFALVIVLLLLTYARFLGQFIGYCVSRPIQSAVLALVVALVYGQLGNGLGLPNLFWSEDPVTRLGVAISATLVLALLGLNAYYLIPADRHEEVTRDVEEFLEAKQGPPLLGLSWLARTLSRQEDGAASPGAERRDPATGLDKALGPIDFRLREWSGWAFVDSDQWLDPPRDETSNPYQLSRFLRLVRLPFLTLLAMPALLPLFFENVPRTAPIVMDIDLMTLYPGHSLFRPDVGGHAIAYALGATLWLFGIWFGVQLIKSFIRASLWFTPNVGPVFEAFYNRMASISPTRWFASRRGASEPLLEIEERKRRSLLTYGLFAVLVYLTLALSPLYSGVWAPSLMPPAYLLVGVVLLVVVPLVVAAVLYAKAIRPGAALADNMKKSSIIVLGVAIVELSFFLVGGLCNVLAIWTGIGFFSYQGIPPAVAILSLLGMVVLLSALFGLTIRDPRWRLLGFVAIFGVVSCNNWTIEDYRFERLDYARNTEGKLKYSLDEWSARARADRPAAEAANPALASDEAALIAWKEACQGTQGSPDGRPKLVVICVSGGAIRAAYWSATVADRIGWEVGGPGPKPGEIGQEARPRPFDKHVRLIAGASGGMVGMPYYVKWLRDGLQAQSGVGIPDDGLEATAWNRGEGKSWVNAIPPFSLRPVARNIALREIPYMFVRSPVSRLTGVRGDRGVELERDWQALRFGFSKLGPAEEAGLLPSLVFSPMTVEDGRRLLISNLDLKFLVNPELPPPNPSGPLLALNRGGDLSAMNAGDDLSPYSLSATEFSKVFRTDGEVNDLYLSTAARMSATFPYVSPAVYLPSDPPLRVVDAGYYDNYGVDIATAWLFQNRDWILSNTSGVLIVQVRDSLSDADRFGYPETPVGTYARLLRGVQFFFSPVEAVAQARYTSSSFRNDAQVAALSDYFTEQTSSRSFLTTATFELSANLTFPGNPDASDWPGDRLEKLLEVADNSGVSHVSMNWYLTVAERKAVEQAIPDPVKLDAAGEATGIDPGSGTSAEALKSAFDVDPLPIDPDAHALAFKQGKAPKDGGILRIEYDDPDQRVFRIAQLKLLRSMIQERFSSGQSTDGIRDQKRLAIVDRDVNRASSYEAIQRIKDWWPGVYSETQEDDAPPADGADQPAGGVEEDGVEEDGGESSPG